MKLTPDQIASMERHAVKVNRHLEARNNLRKDLEGAQLVYESSKKTADEFLFDLGLRFDDDGCVVSRVVK